MDQTTNPNQPSQPSKQKIDEKLDDALDDSFPASDPPAMTVPKSRVGGGKDKPLTPQPETPPAGSGQPH